MSASTDAGRRLTHVELLYRPGERRLAAKLFELLGCQPVDRGGHWFTSFIDPAMAGDYANNTLYASEVGAEQWRFEQALIGGEQLAPAREEYLAFVRSQPQRSTHFGFRVPDELTLDRILERVERAGANDPDLAGRVAVDGVYRPDAPGAIATTMVQAFVWTDVVAAGLVSLGQHIELQWHLPAPA
jgi:hypothetical protein